MSSLHRFILLCLLALAIPLQGFAAAAMSHGTAPVDMAASGDTVEMADSDPSMDMTAHDCAEMKAAPHKGACSACAACCAMAAPGPVFAPTFAALPAATTLLPTRRPRVAFLTGGPKRPPRTRLA